MEPPPMPRRHNALDDHRHPVRPLAAGSGRPHRRRSHPPAAGPRGHRLPVQRPDGPTNHGMTNASWGRAVWPGPRKARHRVRPTGGAMNLWGIRVLAVDDDPDTLDLITRILQAAG